MASEKIDPRTIPGYGMDADPENDPTYPMKNWTGDDHKRINYERASQQPDEVELLMSTERPALPAVFGTSVPPSGLSGMIRRYAFKHSEDRYRHWLPLILADRVNVLEGMIEDLFDAKVPNIFKEEGLSASLEGEKGRVLKKAVMVAAALGAVVWLATRRRS